MTKAILSFIFLGISAASFLWYTKPHYDQIQTMKADVARYDRALEKTRDIKELKISLLQRYNLFAGGNIERLQKMLPDHVDNVRLALDLDGIAAQYGLRVQNLTTEDPAAKKDAGNGATLVGAQSADALPYRTLTMQFQVMATYNDFLQFLRDLESSLRIVDVVQLSLKPGAKAVKDAQGEISIPTEPLYTFAVTLRTYWLK